MTVDRFAALRRARWMWVLAAGAVLVIIAVFCWPLRHQFLARNCSTLAAAALPQRNIEGRLSGFPYRPLESVTRGPGGEETTSPENLKLLSLAAEVASAAKEKPSAENLHAYGVSLLMLGKWNAAVRTLEDALREETGQEDVPNAIRKATDASLLNDLSVGYCARGRRAGPGEDMLRSLNAAERARRVEPSAAAAWNRAVAAEALHLPAATARAWSDLLATEHDSGWRAEAQHRLGAPKTAGAAADWDHARLVLLSNGGAAGVVGRFPQQARVLAEDELLTSWCAALRGGHGAEAVRARRLLSGIADDLSDRGERLLSDSIAVIEHSRLPLDAIDGQLAYAAARREYRAGDLNGAVEGFRRAAALLARAGSPFAMMAQVYRAAALAYSEHYEDSLRIVASLRIDRSRAPAAAGLAWWVRGLDENALGMPLEATSSYEHAVEAFESVGERENLAAVHDALSLAYQDLGLTQRGTLHRAEAAWFAGDIVDVRRRAVSLEGLSEAAHDNDLDFAALSVGLDLVDTANRTGSPEYVATAHLKESQALAGAGLSARALRELETATRAASRIADAALRRRTQLLICSAEAEVAPERAAMALSRGLQSAEEDRNLFWMVRLSPLAARSALASHDVAAARRILDRAVDAVERRYITAPRDVRRIGIEGSRDVYAAYADLLLESGDVAGALSIVQRMQRHSGACFRCAAGASTGAIQAALPPNGIIVVYAKLPRKLAMWTITRSSLRVHETPIDEARLLRMIRDIRAHAIDGDRLTAPDRELSRLLIGPVERELRPGSILVIVPDAELWSVPFAILPRSGTDRLLAQDAEVRLLTSLDGAGGRAASPLPAVPSLTAVANPMLDPRLREDRPELPGSEREVAAAAQLFPRKTLLAGRDATKERFLRAAAGASVIHVASHAALSTESASGAALLLASGPDGESGVLYAREIAQMTLPNTAAIVLSACATVRGENDERLGLLPLSDAFLLAGGHNVIGTLWNVDDQASPAFFRTFYRELLESKSVTQAFRAAQTSFMHSHPARDWAVYELITTKING